MRDWYLLYGGQSEDGMGSPELKGRTYSTYIAQSFYEKNIKGNPYATGKVLKISKGSTQKEVRW